MTSTGRARRYRSTPPRWQGPSRPWGNWFKGGQMGRLSAAVALLVMLGTAAIGWASIPDSAGVIHGCRHRQTGALRVINSDAGQRCSRQERALSWNQTGPSGAQGPAGPQGPPGPQGPAGPPGASGAGRELVERHVTIVTNFDEIRINELVQCPAGKASVNGGFSYDPPAPDTLLGDEYRHVAGGPEGTDWRVLHGPTIISVVDGPVAVTLWAMCVNA